MSSAKIIWINGAFGSGKTTMAYTLYKRLPEAFVFDPENTGYYLRKNQPVSLCYDNFQDEPLWRHINRDLLLHIASHYQGVILVPMTVIRPDYYNLSLPCKTTIFRLCILFLLPVNKRCADDCENVWRVNIPGRHSK